MERAELGGRLSSYVAWRTEGNRVGPSGRQMQLKSIAGTERLRAEECQGCAIDWLTRLSVNNLGQHACAWMTWIERAAARQACRCCDRNECRAHVVIRPNAQVQGRALGVAEAMRRIGVPCNAQLGWWLMLGGSFVPSDCGRPMCFLQCR